MSTHSKADIQQTIRQGRVSRAREQAARLAHLAQNHEVENGTDYGPAVRVGRGEIIREDRPDIEDESAYKRQIRGGRRSDGLRSALSCKTIDHPQWLAGERLRDDMEIADGARDRDYGMPMASNRACGPGEAQIDAMKRCREVMAAVSPGNRGVIRAIVAQYRLLSDIAKASGRRRATALDDARAKLREGLDQIDAYYSDQRRVKIS